MLSLLVTFLIVVLVVCVVAAIVVWILGNIPGVPGWAPRIVWAIAGLVLLIWILEHLGSFGVHGLT